MQVPRPVVPAVLLIVAMVVVPVAGVALANAVDPIVPQVPAGPADPAADIPAMPDAPATIRPLATWFEALPLVESGSAAPPRPFLARSQGVSVGDTVAGARLIDVAFDEIQVPPSARAATREFLHALVRPAPEIEEPDFDEDLDPEETPEVDPFDTPAFRALSERAMNEIEATPANAQALNDLAVAIATTSLVDPTLLRAGPEAATLASSGSLRDAAVKLLELGLTSFPNDRGMTINLAYLRGLEGGFDDLGMPYFSDDLDPAIAALEAHVDGAPTDATARSLLANLVLRTDPERGLDRATAAAQPLIDNPETEAAGRIIHADSLLYAAERDRTRSPFLARSEVRRALDDYDRAIELSGDPSAYAGRAVALDLLGSREAALEAQREAVRLNPDSVPWRLRQAQLEGCVGQTGDWRRVAQVALVVATGIAAQPAKPPSVATRYILADPPARDLGKYSIGSDLPTWDVTIRIPATGATITAIDPFPEPGACMAGQPSVTSAVEDAAAEVALAAIAEDDLAAARAALEPWHFEPTDVDEEFDEEEFEEEEFAETDAVSATSTVLDVLAAGKLVEEDLELAEPDDDFFESFWGLASRLPPDAHDRICRQLSGVVGLRPVDVDALDVCAAEAAERKGDLTAAARAIDRAVRLEDRTNPTDGLTALQAGALSELTGDLVTARSRYEVAAASTEASIGGLVRLGDLDLREGDATGALDHYALAKASVRSQADLASGIVMVDDLAGRLSQYVDNNRGIALLMTARTADDTPPDCVAHAETCREAADGFAAAMTADPMNAVYALNAAWVARLTGDEDRATALLTEALGEGIPLRSAVHNDLGVMAARRGDMTEAGSQFRRAIELEPDYDLATWNLGVLESREAGPLLVAGQALLGRAAELNPELLTRELAFQTDERVYRVEVSGTELELARAPGTGAAVGAAAFGAIATVGALAQLISGLGGDVKDAAETVSTQGLARATRRVLGIGGRLRLGDRGWPSWAAWIPALVVLTVTTAWTASWVAPDAFATALLIGLIAAGLALVVHTCGHLVVAGRFGAKLEASGWTPGLALAVVGMPFHVPAGPFLAEQITTGDQRRDWWVSFAGILANLAAAGIALLIYLWAPMPFLRILIATNLAVAAFALIPSHPLDGDRLATQPMVLALLSLGVAAAAAAIAVGAI